MLLAHTSVDTGLTILHAGRDPSARGGGAGGPPPAGEGVGVPAPRYSYYRYRYWPGSFQGKGNTPGPAGGGGSSSSSSSSSGSIHSARSARRVAQEGGPRRRRSRGGACARVCIWWRGGDAALRGAVQRFERGEDGAGGASLGGQRRPWRHEADKPFSDPLANGHVPAYHGICILASGPCRRRGNVRQEPLLPPTFPAPPPPGGGGTAAVNLTDRWACGVAFRFDLFFRTAPFKGEFCLFAGLDEVRHCCCESTSTAPRHECPAPPSREVSKVCRPSPRQVLKYLDTFSFGEDDITYLRESLPLCDSAFFDYLAKLDCSNVKVFAAKEGTPVFPRVPIIIVEGPLLVVQLLETTLLALVNYASLMTTNAARYRLLAGKDKRLLEFGLRRAQGPDGGISASRYAYLGGFDGTSNVAAAKLFGIPCTGTHAHSYVSSYLGFEDIQNPMLKPGPHVSGDGEERNFVALVKEKLAALKEDGLFRYTNDSELSAFTAYALAFPSAFLALVDTYNVQHSGIPNFVAVALALREMGYHPRGIRLDSGDLGYLSIWCRNFFKEVDKKHPSSACPLEKMNIVVSNDIHEEVLFSLNEQGHSIDSYGIGTHLVTCYKQPALGCVYKLVSVKGRSRIKISEDVEKVTIPGRKRCFRLYGKDKHALVDIMLGNDEEAPKAMWGENFVPTPLSRKQTGLHNSN
eukprot:scaffold668_cov385-Prasinococcus_capsulatus_cf.AAC.18